MTGKTLCLLVACSSLACAPVLSAQVVVKKGDALMVNQGPPGPPGPKGPMGDKGPPGDRGAAAAAVSGYSIRTSGPTTFLAGQGGWITAPCSFATQRAVGGGVQSSSPGDTQMRNSFPVDPSIDASVNYSGWKVFVYNPVGSGTTITAKAFVICVNAVP